MAALGRRRAMAKVLIPLIMIAGIVIVIVLAVTQPSCPAGSYCPPSGGGGSVSTDNGHYTPPDPDVQHEDFHPEPAL
jgi:hypothetical protein